MEERPITPDSEGCERVRKYSPIVRAIGQHWSSDLWVDMETKAGQDLLMEAVDKWLPKLSEHLYYKPKTYPVIVHGFPTPLNAASDVGSEGSDNLASIIVDHNTDIITNTAALKQAKFLGSGQDQLPQRRPHKDCSCCNLPTPRWPTKLLKDTLFLKAAFYPLPSLSAPPHNVLIASR